MSAYLWESGVYECWCLHRSERTLDAGGCESPDMGSGIWIQILLKSGELS